MHEGTAREARYEGLESSVIERSDSAFVTDRPEGCDADDITLPGLVGLASPLPLSDIWYDLVGEAKP